MSKQLYKIIPDTIVKGTGEGYMVCQTDPVHPKSLKQSDRKARYVYVHRVVMENKLGRNLSDEEFEQVDHKDKDKTNNAPSNLELKTRGSHQRDHAMSDNFFWETSLRNKPKRKKKASQEDLVLEVVMGHLQQNLL